MPTEAEPWYAVLCYITATIICWFMGQNKLNWWIFFGLAPLTVPMAVATLILGLFILATEYVPKGKVPLNPPPRNADGTKWTARDVVEYAKRRHT